MAKSSFKKFFVKIMARALSAILMVSISSVAECSKSNSLRKKTNSKSTIEHPLSSSSSKVKKKSADNSSESNNSGKDSSSSSAGSVSSICHVSEKSANAEKTCEEAQDKVKKVQEKGFEKLEFLAKVATDVKNRADEEVQKNLHKTEKDFEVVEATLKTVKENKNKSKIEKTNAEKKFDAAAIAEQESSTEKANAENCLKITTKNSKIQPNKKPEISSVPDSQIKLEPSAQTLTLDCKKEPDNTTDILSKVCLSDMNCCKASYVARYMAILQEKKMIDSVGRNSLVNGKSNLILGIWHPEEIFTCIDINIIMANRFFEPYFKTGKYISPFNVFRITFDGLDVVYVYANGIWCFAQKVHTDVSVEKMIKKLFESGYVSCINCGEEVGVVGSIVASVNFDSEHPSKKIISLDNKSSVSLKSIVKNIKSIEILIPVNDPIQSVEDLEAFFRR